MRSAKHFTGSCVNCGIRNELLNVWLLHSWLNRYAVDHPGKTFTAEVLSDNFALRRVQVSAAGYQRTRVILRLRQPDMLRRDDSLVD